MPKARVAQASSLQRGQMRQVTIGETEVLLARYEGQLYALGARCPHQGAPLAEGILHDRRLVCPWHGSVFDVTSGEALEPPTLDSLRRFRVSLEDDDVLVEAPARAESRRPPEMVTLNEEEDIRTFVIVGAGAAGLAAAQELRRVGFQGKIVLVGEEHRPPYDRTRCSKDYLAGQSSDQEMPLRSDEFYPAHGIQRVTQRVVRLDLSTRTVVLDDGTSLKADRLLLTTGASPRVLELPGAHLEQVFTLRSWRDAARLGRSALEARHAVVVGTSFIGMETAAALRQRGVSSVTVVGPETVPLARVFGERIGRMIQRLHEDRGVVFHLGVAPTALEGGSRVEAVVLEGGQRLEADLVVVGIGVRPATDFVAGVLTREDGGLVTDSYLRVAEGVYAAGDIAAFPDARTGEPVRIEHWRVAQQQGQVAAHNMAGQPEAFTRVPFFWTSHYETTVAYLGHAPSWDEILYEGEVESQSFLAYYLKEGRLSAAAACGRDRQVCALHELMLQHQEPSAEELRRGGVDLVQRLSSMGPPL